MITINSRDLLTLFHDLGAGFVSGQELEWIEERIGPNYVAYNSLLVARWDHRAVKMEGQNFAGLMRLFPTLYEEKIQIEKPGVLSVAFDNFIRMDVLKKDSGAVGYHLHIPEIEFPRAFMKLILDVDAILEREKATHLAPVAFHITRLNFSRVTMPFLLPILGRRAFFDAELSEVLNKDLDNLKHILSDKYKRKKHQAVWRLVKKHMGTEEVY